jgi:hypothetical protein
VNSPSRAATEVARALADMAARFVAMFEEPDDTVH